jgi:starch phosphorylase
MNLYLLDTDNELNSEWDRQITHQLYGGDWENRIKQEILLGIGGMLALKKLGIKKDVYHCNEGHAALMGLQRLVDLIQEEGLTFNQAKEVVRASGLYTCHTPVPAGHDYFEEG